MNISQGQFTIRVSSSTTGWTVGHYILENHPRGAKSKQRFGGLTAGDVSDLASLLSQAMRQIEKPIGDSASRSMGGNSVTWRGLNKGKASR